MYHIRTIIICSVAAVLFGSLVVNAAPMPLPQVQAHRVSPGTVMMAQPAQFHPQRPEHSGRSGNRFHPVIAIGHPNEHGWVPVVPVSHNHPMEGHHVDAHHYDHHTHAAGHGFFEDDIHGHHSQVAINHPTHVHVSNLQYVHPDSNLPHQLHHTDTQHLLNHVYQATGVYSQNHPHPVPDPVTPPWHHHAI